MWFWCKICHEVAVKVLVGADSLTGARGSICQIYKKALSSREASCP